LKLCARFQGARFVLVLVLVLENQNFIEDENENEDDTYQIRSPESAHV
jgi:hypothetical protein